MPVGTVAFGAAGSGANAFAGAAGDWWRGVFCAAQLQTSAPMSAQRKPETNGTFTMKRV